MFSHIVNIDLNHKFTINISELFVEFNKLSKQLHLEYEEANIALNETNEKIALKEEEYSLFETKQMKHMSELALHIQNNCNLKMNVNDLKNVLSSTEFDLKKCNRMELSAFDLETRKDIKKTFITYKHILKIHFDYSNGPNTTIQKGYIFNKITLRLAYFEFNKEEKTANEISDYLWRKMNLISENKWNMLSM